MSVADKERPLNLSSSNSRVQDIREGDKNIRERDPNIRESSLAIREADPQEEVQVVQQSKGAKRLGRVSEGDFVDVVDIAEEDEEEVAEVVTNVRSQAVQIRGDLLEIKDKDSTAQSENVSDSAQSSDKSRISEPGMDSLVKFL